MGKNVIVIGGGIIGLCSAYYLQQEGHQVTIVEKSNFTSGASHINAGYITPSHFISLASPGTVYKGLKWMFNSRSPLYIKPRLDSDLLKWAWAFNKSATSSKVEKAIKPLLEINLMSKHLYEDLKSSKYFNFHYQNKGLLMCYKTDKVGEEEWEVGKRGIEEGLKVENLSAIELKNLEPALNVKGAIYYHSDAHMTPNDFMTQMLNYLKFRGVKVFESEEVVDIELSGCKLSELKTDKRNLQCDEVVLSSGSWSALIAKKLGLKLPIQAGKGYSINVKRETNITIPAILCEAKIAVTPMDGFTRFAGTMEMAGINNDVNPIRVNAIANASETYYKNLKILDNETHGAKCGLRPCSPDGLPYIGRASKYDNLTIATGHAMMGWSLGPATGKLVSEIISERETSLEILPFNPERRF